jgi:hypothetical protein
LTLSHILCSDKQIHWFLLYCSTLYKQIDQANQTIGATFTV